MSESEGRSSSDKFIVLGIGLMGIGFFAWFMYELSMGLGAVPDELTGPKLFRAYGCASCHIMEGSGSNRGPNLGSIDRIAAERAQERAKATNKAYTPADFIAESIILPDAYITPRYSAGIMRKPGGMTPVQLKKLTAFLLKVPVTDEAVVKATERFLPKPLGAVQSDPAWPETRGNAERGQTLFHAQTGNAACTRCHAVKADDNRDLLGPNLYDVGVNKASYIYESIKFPSKSIAPQFRQVIVFNGQNTLAGRVDVQAWPASKPGRLRIREVNGDKEIPFTTLHFIDDIPLVVPKPGTHVKRHVSNKGRVPSGLIDTLESDESGMTVALKISPTSAMPNFKAVIGEQQMEDLVRYLLTLKANKKP